MSDDFLCKEMAILAGWLSSVLLVPHKEGKRHTPLWAFVPLTLSTETPSTTHRGPPKGSEPHLVIVFGSSRVNHSLQGPVLWGNMAEPTHDLKWPHFSKMNPPSLVHKHLAQWLKHMDFCVYKFNTHYTPNKASLVKIYRIKKKGYFSLCHHPSPAPLQTPQISLHTSSSSSPKMSWIYCHLQLEY